MLEHASPCVTPRHPNANGLGQDWDPKRPKFGNIDLVSRRNSASTRALTHSLVPLLPVTFQTKPDPRIRAPDLAIECENEDSVVAFVDVSILDSTGAEPYCGDVLVKGKRIVSVGEKLTEEVLASARVFHGEGRTLMSGMGDAHTHFSWTNAGSLDGLATMPVEEHTLFSMRSARTFSKLAQLASTRLSRGGG